MEKLRDALAFRLCAKMHGKPRAPKNNNDTVVDQEPRIDHVQENERTKRKLTPMTMLSPSRRQADGEAQWKEDLRHEKSTARRVSYEHDYTKSSCECSDNESSSGSHYPTEYDKYSDCKAQKQPASDFCGEQLTFHCASALSIYGSQSTSDTDLRGYDPVSNAVLNTLVEQHEMGVFREHDRGRTTHKTTQGRSIRDRAHAPVSPRRRYTNAFREKSHDNTDSGALGDIDDVPHLTAKKRTFRRQRHEREPTVIEDMIEQIPRADEMAQEYRREDSAHEQHHYGVLASVSIGNIALTEGGRKQRIPLFTSVDPDGMTHSHSFCDSKIETGSKPRHGRYRIRTDTQIEEFPLWGLQKPSICPASHVTPHGKFGRRYDSLWNLVSIDNETIYRAPDRRSSKGKAFGSFPRTGEKNVSLEKDLAGSMGKANGRFDSAARTQRANSFEQKDGRQSGGYDADVNEGSHGLSKKSPGLFGFGSTADEHSFSSGYGQSSYPPSEDSDDEAMPPSIPMFRSHASPRTPKKASNGSRRRFAPEPLGSGPKTPSRMDHEQIEDRSSSFLRRAPVEVVNSMEAPVPRTPTSPSTGRNSGPLSGENLFLGGNPYKKLLDRKINPRSKSSTTKSSKRSSRPALDHVIPQSASSLSFLGDTPAADDTSGHGLAQSKKRRRSKNFQGDPLQLDPRNGEEVENFLVESITPPAQKLPQQDVSNYSQGSARSKVSARSTSSQLTKEEALDIVIDTLFAPDKPKNPFRVLNPPVAESSLPEETKYKPRRKSMLSQQLCWLSPADAETHLRSRKELSDEEVRDSGSASSLPFQVKREHSSKMRLTQPSIRPVDSFSSSMEIKSRGTVVSPATSAAMGPGQTSGSHRRISPLALHGLDTPLNDSFPLKRLNLRTPMETTEYIIKSRRSASTLALHGSDRPLYGPLKRLSSRPPMERVHIMHETQESQLRSTKDSLIPKTQGSLRQKVFSGLSRVASMMRIKVENEDDDGRMPPSKREKSRAEKPRKLSNQPKFKGNRTSSGAFIKQEVEEEPSMLKKSFPKWSGMTTKPSRALMRFDGTNDEREYYATRPRATMGFDGANDDRRNYPSRPRASIGYDGAGDDGEDYSSRPRASLGYNGANDDREGYTRSPTSAMQYDNTNEDMYNSYDEYTEEMIENYVTSDEENVPLLPTPRPRLRSATNTQRPSAAASDSASRNPRVLEHASRTQEVSRHGRRAEGPQQLQSPVVKTLPHSPAPTRSAPLPPRVKVEDPSSDNTIVPANTITTNPVVIKSARPEKDTSPVGLSLLKTELQVRKRPQAKTRKMEPYSTEYKPRATQELRTSAKNDSPQKALSDKIASALMDKFRGRLPLKSLGGKSANQIASYNIAQSASEKQKHGAGSWQAWHAHHASKNKLSAPMSSRLSAESARQRSMYLGPPKPKQTCKPITADQCPALRFTDLDPDSKPDSEQAKRLIPEPLEPVPEFYEKNDLIAIAQDKMPKVRPTNYDLWILGLPEEFRPDAPPPNIAEGYTKGARQPVKPVQYAQRQQPTPPARIRLPQQTAEEADDLDEGAPIFDLPKRVYRRAFSSHAFSMMEDIEVRPRSLSAPDTARFLRIADQVALKERNESKSASSDAESLQWLLIWTEIAQETRDLVGAFAPEEMVLPENSIIEEDHGSTYDGLAYFIAMAEQKASIARLNFIAAARHRDAAMERWTKAHGVSHNSSNTTSFPSFQDSIFSANPSITKETAETFLTDFTSYQKTSFSAGPILANRRVPTIARFFPEWTQHKSHIVKPHLLGIPSKIRYQIYGHLFAKDFSHPVLLSPLNTTKGFWPDDFFAAPNAFLGNFEGASLACHQLRDEVLAFYFTHFRFHITLNNLIVPSIAPKLYKCVPIFAHRIEHLTIELDFTKGAGDYRDGAACLPDGIDELRQLFEMVIEPMAKRDTPIRALQIMVRRYDGIRPSHQLQPRPDEFALDGEFSESADDFRWEISSEESSLGDYDYQSELQNLKAGSKEFGKPVVIYRERAPTPGNGDAPEQDEDQDEAEDEEEDENSDSDEDGDQDEEEDEEQEEEHDEFDTTWTRLYRVPPDSDLSPIAGSSIESRPGTPRSATPAPQKPADSPLSSIHATRFGIQPGTPQAAMTTPQPQRIQRRSVSESLWKDMLKKRTNTNEMTQSPELSARAQRKQPASPQFADSPNLARVERMSSVSSRLGTPSSANSAVPLTRSGRRKRVSFDEELSRRSGSFGRSNPSYQTGSPRFEYPPVGSMRVASPTEDSGNSPPKKEIKPAKYLGGTPPPFPSFRKAPRNILVEKVSRASRALSKSQVESGIGSWLSQTEPSFSGISEDVAAFDRTLLDYENDDVQEMTKLLREQKYWDGADDDSQPLQAQPLHGYIEEYDDEGISQLINEEMVIARVVEKFRRVHSGILPVELVVRDDQGRKRYIEAEPLPRKQPKPVEMFVPYMPHDATKILDILIDYLAPPHGPGALTLRLSGFPEDYMQDIFKAIIGPGMNFEEPIRPAWQKYIPKAEKVTKALKVKAGARVASSKQTPMMKTMHGVTSSGEVQPHAPPTP